MSKKIAPPKRKVLVIKLVSVDTYLDYQTLNIPAGVEVREVDYEEEKLLRSAIGFWNTRNYHAQMKVVAIATEQEIDDIIAEYQKAEAKKEKRREEAEQKRLATAEARKRIQFEKLKKELGE